MIKPKMFGGRLTERWTVFILGLLYVSTKCDARAVNISNSWTMPQEGLDVFYRFFRDNISWFEAEAVCQFHHARLVVVDNSFQFDATREFLKELDVNDNVWIGLKRPRYTPNFLWSNSKRLDTNTGYWAESLPLIQQPLCAAIDPIRDYRWHALRCGGPETASFMCEMSVPLWLSHCIIRDMPSLTIQYMADTGSVELIRDCGDEGFIQLKCKTKIQDRTRALQRLVCPQERRASKKISDSMNSHLKSLQIIRNITTDNNENNNIELLAMKMPETTEQAQTEKNTVQKLIEQFNVDELMQADEPVNIPGEIPKPVKKSAKKIVVAIPPKKQESAPKKTSSRNFQRQAELEEMMMGDEAIPDNASNEIMAPLPHIKKVLPQDLLKKMSATETTYLTEPSTTVKLTSGTSKQPDRIEIIASASPLPSYSSQASVAAEQSIPQLMTTSEPLTTSVPIITTSTVPEVISTQPVTIGHPMHPQQPRSNIISAEASHPHVKETNDNHFIPPMLLVKSHYVPPPKGYADHSSHTVQQDSSITTSIPDKMEATRTTIENIRLEESNLQSQATSTSVQVGDTTAPQSFDTTTEKSAHGEIPLKKTPTNSSEIQLHATTTASSETTKKNSPTGISFDIVKAHKTPEFQPTTTAGLEQTTDGITATISNGDDSGSASDLSSAIPTSPQAVTIADETSPPAPAFAILKQSNEQSNRVTEKTEIPSTTLPASGDSEDVLSSSSPASPLGTSDPSTENFDGISTIASLAADKVHEQTALPHPTRNFLNEETYPPFKPNRRRSLTQPETLSYFKKILG